MHYIGCINTEDQNNWSSMGFFTAFGLDLAIKTTAGLIREFIEESDSTPPVVTITSPVAGSYLHTDKITLGYAASDQETGIRSVAASLDGSTMISGHPLTNGLTIDLLTELLPGTHTLEVRAIDNARPRANGSTASATFDVVVTPDSLVVDVNRFLDGGEISSADGGNSLLKQLAAAAKALGRGNCDAAANIYSAFIAHVQAQTGKSIDAAAAAILIADAQYLITHCS